MTKRILPTPEELRRLLRYDLETGKLFWKERPAEMFSAGRTSSEAYCKIWNTRFAGKEAFATMDNHGYVIGSVFGRIYKAHRVIWAIYYGEWPEDQIDHVDGDGLNNRIGNLREATHTENMRNRRAWKTNKSGYKGVSWHSGAYRAQIKFEGKTVYLGHHATAEDAHAAYYAAAEKLHGEFARTE